MEIEDSRSRQNMPTGVFKESGTKAQTILVTLMAIVVPTRIRAKSLLLTYPHCSIDKDTALEAIWESCQEWDPLYAVCCEEAHQDGEPHLHCFISCSMPVHVQKKDIRMFDLVKGENLFHCNIKTCKSPKDAIRYVKKHGNFISKGTCPFKECTTCQEKNKLLQSKSLSELVESGEVSIFKIPQLSKAISILSNELLENKRRLEAPKVYWFYGETGTGKTKEAVRIGEEEFGGDYWISNSGDDWYDGYRGQKCVILDDIRATNWKFNNMLRLTDRYRLRVPVKGSFVQWLPETIIITAPGTPEEVYSNHSTGETFDGIEQLLRRITEIREFK